MPTETKSTHTAGPWNAIAWTCNAATTVAAKSGNDLIVVADCGGFGRPTAESLADARLIAAAPELLEALEATLSEFESIARNTNRGYGYGQAVCISTQTREQVKAAIYKAKGE